MTLIPDGAVLLVFCRSRTWRSWLTRFLTRSDWSHVALVLSDGRAVESVPKFGVRFTTLHDLLREHEYTELRTIGPFLKLGCPDQPDVFEVVDKIGKPYDPWADWMIFTPNRRWRRDDRWSSAELIAQATPLLTTGVDWVSIQMLYLLSKPLGTKCHQHQNF